MRRGGWGALLLVLLLPAVALAGRLFQWKDKEGTTHASDNLWDLPPALRTQYLELIEEAARKKYAPDQIRSMKERGEWPPSEFVRPTHLPTAAQDLSWTGFQVLGTSAQAQQAVAVDHQHQWGSFFQERKDLQQGVAQAEKDLPDLENDYLLSLQMDAAMGRQGDAAQAPAKAAALAEAKKKVSGLKEALVDLPRKELELLSGKSVYSAPNPDGGVPAATLKPAAR